MKVKRIESDPPCCSLLVQGDVGEYWYERRRHGVTRVVSDPPLVRQKKWVWNMVWVMLRGVALLEE